MEINQIFIHIHGRLSYIGVKSQSYINFTKMEKVLETYFHQYEGRYLNDLKCFKESIPTMENIGRKIFVDISNVLDSNNLILNSLEISENPTRTYIIKK